MKLLIYPRRTFDHSVCKNKLQTSKNHLTLFEATADPLDCGLSAILQSASASNQRRINVASNSHQQDPVKRLTRKGSYRNINLQKNLIIKIVKKG